MSIGERLRKERDRLDLSQTKFGALGGVGKKTQVSYEQDKTSPPAKYLAAVASAGVDIWYVVIGRPNEVNIAEYTFLNWEMLDQADRGRSDPKKPYAEVARPLSIHHLVNQSDSAPGYGVEKATADANPASIVPGRSGETAIAQGSRIDWTWLRQIIVGVEAFLSDRQVTLGPAKKAAVIIIMYAKFSESKRFDPTRFNEFMEAAMAAV